MTLRRLCPLLLVFACLSAPPVAAAKPAPVRLTADLSCSPGGGADVTFSIRNLGRRPLEIKGDFHLTLYARRGPGKEPVTVAFVFPAPAFSVIPPRESRTFLVPMGTGEEGDPGADLSARHLILEAEVWFAGREPPVRRYFSFPGC